MRLLVSPERAPLDEPVTIQLHELEPGTSVPVRAHMAGYIGQAWSAEASFVSDAGGTVDLGRDAPLSGSYQGVDPMGLFWSMRPETGPDVRLDPDAPLTVTLTADVNGGAIGSATIERLIFADDVIRTRVREQGLIGSYFRPKADGSYPGVLVLGGSGGGLRGSYWQAAVLARHGFAALALAYFAMESLPERLANIPLEYFVTALDWLSAQPDVGGDRVGVIGTSRGGELVLLLGATFPEQVGAIVAYVPSHVVWSGFGRGVANPTPSWTLDGEPISMVLRSHPPTTPPPPDPPSDVPFALTPRFLRLLEDREEEQRAAIPVERIDGPVLLISGREDAMWPSALMAERATTRLHAHRHPYPVEHLAYSGAGHSIYLPHLPTTVTASVHPIEGRLYDLGGSPRANAYAAADSWPRVVRFLADGLRR